MRVKNESVIESVTEGLRSTLLLSRRHCMSDGNTEGRAAGDKTVSASGEQGLREGALLILCR